MLPMIKSITLSKSDHIMLQAYVERSRFLSSQARESWQSLGEELRQAYVVPDYQVPANVVRIGSAFTVSYLDTDERETFVLVHPELGNIAEGRLSITTPLGMAVIGFAAGDEIDWVMPRGLRRLRLVAVKPPHDH